jgi:serine phosphatase RsbU (regulator of sigma subunit)
MPERSCEPGPWVLVVEEDARKRERIRSVFARHGYQVEAAEGEQEAIAKVREIPFDVALLSAHLSGALRFSSPSSRLPTTPSGSSHAERLAPGLTGSQEPQSPRSRERSEPGDGLPKVLNRLRPEMVCLVLNRRSYRRASLSTAEMLAHTERLLRQRDEHQRNRRLARCFRETLLPQPLLQAPGYRIAGVYEPGGHRESPGAASGAPSKSAGHSASPSVVCSSHAGDGLGGDFFDLFPIPDGRMGLMIGDVAGRGLEVASTTAMARFYARAYAHQEPVPARVLQATNLALARDLPEERFVTLFFGLLDSKRRTLHWASAGHDPPYLLLPGAETPRCLGPTGMALGIHPEATFEECSLEIPADALLLLYTDGVTDPWERNGAAEPAPLVPLLVAARDLPPEEVARHILTAAREEARGALEDDVSLIVLRGV